MSSDATAVTATDAAPATPGKTPHDLILEEDVKIALVNDKGHGASLTSYSIKDFTAKGDNYASVVSSVSVQYVLDGQDLETSYVVKLNPCRSAEFDAFTKVIFIKEIGFYTQLLPLINAELVRVAELPLRVPKYFHSVGTDFQEVIYLEDLRMSGYRMFDRKKGMDKEHTELILTELARMHAASVLLMSRAEYSGADMVERLPILAEGFDAMNSENSKMKVDNFIPGLMDNGANIASRCKGYEVVSDYLKANSKNGPDILWEQLKMREQFKVICHGDSWNNNFVFRYSADGSVQECRLLDLQLTRVGSPTLDLNYMLYCSLTGETRRKEMKAFMSTYYSNFASVLAGGGVATKFTLHQLKQEFTNKNKFGLLMSLMLIPMVLMDSEDVPNIEDYVGDDTEANMVEYQEAIMVQVQKNPLLKPRLLALFDEMIESGVIC